MSSLPIDLKGERRRRARRRHVIESFGLTPSRILARLFMSALAGLLALHFWRDGER